VLISYKLPAVVAAAAAIATATAATATATTTTAATTTAIAAAAVTTTAAAVTTATAAKATTATTAAKATAATAAVTAAAATTKAAAAAAAALLALLGFVDAERASVEGATVHALDRLGRLFGRTHGHEGEAARAACLAIGDKVDVANGSEFLERLANAISIGVEREISDVQTSVHAFVLDLAQRAINPPRRGPWCFKAGSGGNAYPLSTGQTDEP
jgi:hypothetical protein